VTQTEAARRLAIPKIQQMLSAFGIKDGLLVKDADARHKQAVRYMIDNPEFQSALRGLIAVRADGAPYGSGGEKLSAIITTISMILEDSEEFKSAQYYQGSLHVTNQVSSILLDALPGALASDVLDISAAAATAYTYSFFWGR
jgi:hypothetical protein